MPYGENLVAEPTLESLQADMHAEFALQMELTSAIIPQLTARRRDIDGVGAHGYGHAEAIDKAFRFRPALLRRLNEIKRVQGERGVSYVDVGVDVGVGAAAIVGADAKVRVIDGVGPFVGAASVDYARSPFGDRRTADLGSSMNGEMVPRVRT
eukprot:jgi/Tetstr1/441651/TSEL_029876.t1